MIRTAILGLVLLAAPAWAAVQVNVQVLGLEPPLESNVLATLSIEH